MANVKKPRTTMTGLLNLDRPELFVNRELSWLEFNDRVMREGLSADVPLLERLKFLSIVGSNLDEFYMIRVAVLKQHVAAGVETRDISGMSPAQQLDAISSRVARMVKEQYEGIVEVLKKLAENGIGVLPMNQLSPNQKQFVNTLFSEEILPSLTPLAIEELTPGPILPGLGLNLAFLVECRDGPEAPLAQKIIVVPVPRALPRFVTLPAERGLELVPLEEVISALAPTLLPSCTILARMIFRLTRDADVDVREYDPQEIIEAMERAVRERKRRGVVRLEVSAGADTRLKDWAAGFCKLNRDEVLEVAGPLDASALMEIASRPGFESLKDPPWPPQPARDLVGADDLWTTLQDRDVMLFHPYESFDPTVRMIELAAGDPNVLAIKQTLYRTSGASPIIDALAKAAAAGKQVTVLVELKARFDESRNVTWARKLEDAGCYVIYGITGFKTHAKALLVIRREAHRVRRYVHLSTGNYNDRTARVYSDLAIMTSDADVAADAAAFFNLLTGSSQPVGWKKFVLAPIAMRDRLIEMIQREVETSTPESPGLIMVKLNSLQDKRLCQELYSASRAGVKIMLNVRGICCLKPGVPGVSDNIQVVSIVDRFLEHSRILYFRNGGHEELYLSSSDWMVRNLDKRLELMFPVSDRGLKDRLIGILNTYFADNVKSWRMNPDGTYSRVPTGRERLRAQDVFYQQAIEAAQVQPVLEFEPLKRPVD